MAPITRAYKPHSKVNDQIYNASMGVTSLSDVVRTIEFERDTLFRNRGRSRKIYVAHERLQDIDGNLKRVAENASRYGELPARLQQVESELEGLTDHRKRIQPRQVKLTRLQRAWDA